MSRNYRKSWRTVAAGIFLLFVLLAGIVDWRTSRALRLATQEVRTESEIRFTMRPFSELQDQVFETVSTPAVFLQAAGFLGDLYIAGPAGLSQYSANGRLRQHYAVGQDLPSSPLVAMAPATLADGHQPELIIATAQDGLLAFNGRAFRQILPHDANARTITAVLPVSSGHLLIGTKKRGVLVYDGAKITIFHPSLSNLEGTGKGHGIGLCQAGARAMAQSGATFREILDHYYPNTTLVHR
jgi:hypothetical protein